MNHPLFIHKKKRFIIAFTVILGGFFLQDSSAQNTNFINLSSTKARPLAMGGAFQAVEGDMSTIGFNPAGFGLYRVKQKRLALFVNPISPIIAGAQTNDLYNGQGSRLDDLFFSLGFLIKSVAFSFNTLHVGFLFGEQNIAKLENDNPSSVSRFRQNHSHSIVSSLKLAKQVSIGASATLLFESKRTIPEERKKGVGISYGILLEPETGLKIGVAFVNLPDSIQQDRMEIERIVDESINAGLSYQFSNTRFSVDVRNIGEERSQAVREFHAGFEQVFFSHLALRAGWFDKSQGGNVYSFGFGLFNGNNIRSLDKAFGHDNFFVNYAFILDNTKSQKNQWHLFSLYFRI